MAEKTKAEPIVFGVLQKKEGTYSLGEAKFYPLTATPVPVSTKELACEESSPVKFFETREAAEKEIAKLALQFAKKRPVEE
jgi:hypothetical protein